MLDRAKVSTALARVADKLFIEHGHHVDEVYALWLELAADPLFATRVLHAPASEYNPPLWEGSLNVAFNVNQTSKPYVVHAIDGSQIYPDRHQGTACYLLNIGTVMLEYGWVVLMFYFLMSHTFIPVLRMISTFLQKWSIAGVWFSSCKLLRISNLMLSLHLQLFAARLWMGHLFFGT